MERVTGFFLGAITPGGFRSLYKTELEKYDTIYILKGSPGCGKSTLMRRCAHALEDKGLEVEYIFCSSDSNSLDAVLFPSVGAAIVDGTAPHVAEPRYACAGEYYVNLGEHCDRSALRAMRPQIRALTDEYRALFEQVYSLMSAAGELHSLRLGIARPLSSGLTRRAEGIIKREIGKRSGERPGTEHVRFLSTTCSEGVIYRFDAARERCSRLYEIRSEFGLGHELLSAIRHAALSAGHDLICCPSPMDPDGPPEHLLIPSVGLGFLTVEREHPLGEECFRRIFADRTLDREALGSWRSHLRSVRRSEAALRGQAVTILRRAQILHERIEALYNPHVDFAGVFRTADSLSKEILGLTK